MSTVPCRCEGVLFRCANNTIRDCLLDEHCLNFSTTRITVLRLQCACRAVDYNIWCQFEFLPKSGFQIWRSSIVSTMTQVDDWFCALWMINDYFSLSPNFGWHFLSRRRAGQLYAAFRLRIMKSWINRYMFALSTRREATINSHRTLERNDIIEFHLNLDLFPYEALAWYPLHDRWRINYRGNK